MAKTSISYLIGYYRGKPYTMVVRPDYSKLEKTPGVKDAFKVSINIYYRTGGEQHEIVRIDNSHEQMHIHRLYSSQPDERERIEMDYWEAMEYLQDNWERFARLYDRNHG